MEPNLPSFFDELSKIADVRLHPHQRRAIEKLLSQDGLVVAHGLGSGKTLTSLVAGEGRGAVALVPASLQENYLKEKQKHRRGKDVVVGSLQGAVVRGEVPRSGLLIVDEAHRARNPGSKTHQELKRSGSKKMLLTGSPAYNLPEDIAPLVNLAAGKQVLPQGAAFRKRFIARPARGIWGLMPWTRKREELIRTGELGSALEKWVDYHPGAGEGFPDRVDSRVKTPMSVSQTQLHDEAWGRLPWILRFRLRRGLPPEKKDLPKINKFQSQARQISGSERAFGGDASVPKVQIAAGMVADAVGEDGEHKALVYSNYLNTLDDYADELDSKGVPYGRFTGSASRKEKKQLVDDFNSGKIKALLVSSAGGEGLDLKGTRQVQILDPHWNDEKIEQVIGRAIRYGSHDHLDPEKRSVSVQRFEALPLSNARGIDQVLNDMSENKTRLNRQLLELL